MGNIIGGIAGDIIGSVYEWNNCKGKNDIEFFKPGCKYTDDTVLTCAVAKWLIDDDKHESRTLAELLKKFGKKYPNAGYGGKFRAWLNSDGYDSVGSYGNGAGMRVSPVGYYASSYEEAIELAKTSAEITHGHPEGIKGAQAIAGAVFLACMYGNKKMIKERIEKDFGYDLSRGIWSLISVDDAGDITSRSHKFDATCQVTVPEAIIAFLESNSYEDCINNALLIGGDSDTIADMAGAIAGAYYGVPQWIQESAMNYLPEYLAKVVMDFDSEIMKLNYYGSQT